MSGAATSEWYTEDWAYELVLDIKQSVNGKNENIKQEDREVQDSNNVAMQRLKIRC